MELGKRIVEELGPNESLDTLTRWMAHYVAELMHAAEAATGEERRAQMAACAGAILDLWNHRARLPNGRRPFEELEPMLRTLESLDLNADALRYYRSQPETIEENAQSPGARQWIRMAKGLDYSARVLIRHCLACAAESALDKSGKWVELAEAAGADQGVELPVVRFVTSEIDLLQADDPDEKQRRAIEDRIARLGDFQRMIPQVLAHFRDRLK